MSGWRQDQYLDQAYHAMALQPARSAVASEGGLPLVAFDARADGDASAMTMSLGIPQYGLGLNGLGRRHARYCRVASRGAPRT
jgi:hypothetical protein